MSTEIKEQPEQPEPASETMADQRKPEPNDSFPESHSDGSQYAKALEGDSPIAPTHFEADVRGRVEKINSESWDRTEMFTAAHDDQGRVTRIEGWLSLREGDRTSADTQLQKETREAAGPDDPEKPRDAFHLLAYKLGGPAAEGAGSKHAEDNMLIGDARVNRSFMGFERQAQARLEQGDELYCQVDIAWPADEEPPTHLTHRYFTRSSENQSPQFLAEIRTKIDDRPSATVGEALQFLDKTIKPKDWYQFSPKKNDPESC